MESASKNEGTVGASTPAQAYDAIFLGGGLSSCIAAYLFRLRYPDARVAIIERESRLAGNHTWCFHSSDIEANDFFWLHPLLSRSWSGYRVHFPSYERTFNSGYHAIESSHLNEVMQRHLGEGVFLGVSATAVDAEKVKLSDGRVLSSSIVVDGRGWSDSDRPLGYQKFLGQKLILRHPHRVYEPILMDATCQQVDGYRFFYVLPWGPSELLVEDTHYSDTADIDAPLYRDQIQRYCSRSGWSVESVTYEEQGSLPLPLSAGPLPGHGIIRSGLRGELFHATTGYSFPSAVAFAKWLVSARKSGSVDSFADWAKQFQGRQAFFRTLNRLLFRVALPQHRRRLLEHFYRLPEGLVQSFYRGEMKPQEKVRFFLGRPPVSIRGALTTLLTGERVARV